MKLQFFVDKTSVKTKQKRRLLERRAKRGCVRNLSCGRQRGACTLLTSPEGVFSCFHAASLKAKQSAYF